MHGKVTALCAGSLTVDDEDDRFIIHQAEMLIAKAAGDDRKKVQDLEEQLKSPSSLLLQDKVTRQCRETKKGPAFAAETEDEQDVRCSSVMQTATTTHSIKAENYY
jgi:hypothetical protein